MSQQPAPRKLVQTRALRYDTWPELQRAVLAWCQDRIAEENPTFDVAALEAQLNGRVGEPSCRRLRSVPRSASPVGRHLGCEPS